MFEQELEFNGIPGSIAEVARFCQRAPVIESEESVMLVFDIGISRQVYAIGHFLGHIGSDYWWKVKANTEVKNSDNAECYCTKDLICVTYQPDVTQLENSYYISVPVLQFWPICGTIQHEPLR